ncbi:hypothetical protein L1887_45988 [Cichorium endivia]|nr:hypothetical protein L1887_45988 [Cichorium endivia]
MATCGCTQQEVTASVLASARLSNKHLKGLLRSSDRSSSHSIQEAGSLARTVSRKELRRNALLRRPGRNPLSLCVTTTSALHRLQPRTSRKHHCRPCRYRLSLSPHAHHELAHFELASASLRLASCNSLESSWQHRHAIDYPLVTSKASRFVAVTRPCGQQASTRRRRNHALNQPQRSGAKKLYTTSTRV